MNRYELAVAYRIYPQVSKPAVALRLPNDKYRLAEMCLKSFRESLGDLRVKMWVLLDGCPAEYREIFHRHFREEDLVFLELDHVGNQATFEKQIDILLSQKDAEAVYFAEDDYFYLPKQFPDLLELLNTNNEVHYVSPFDHPDPFRLELHRNTTSLQVSNRRYWSLMGSTCLTFLTKRETLRRTQHVFRTYSHGNHDCSLWLSLTKQAVLNPLTFWRCLFSQGQRGQTLILAKAWLHGWRQILFGRRWNLWIPIPGIATHLDAQGLSPSVDWLTLMTQEIEASNTPVFLHE